MSSPRRRGWPAVTALVVSLGALVACGIASDAEPRSLAVTTSTTEVPSVPTSGGAQGVLWFVRDGKLVPADRSLPDARPGTVLDALMEAPDDVEAATGLSSSIPAGTRLLGTRLEDGTMEVDLSRAFDDVVGPAKQLAIAQIVMTATEFREVRNLRFRVAGRDIQVASPTRGDTDTVSDCDFASLLPTELVARELAVPTPTLERLRARREQLARDCPAETAGD